MDTIFNRAFIFLPIFLLTACSNSPSESEVKSNLSSAIDNCSFVSVKSVKKTNGFPDGSNKNKYVMEVDFELHANPKKEMELIYKDYSDKLEKFNKIKAKLDSMPTDSPEIPKILEDAGVDGFDASGYGHYKRQVVYFDCRPKNRIANGILSRVIDSRSEYSEKVKLMGVGGDVKMSGKFSMIKTDNGWMFE
ncbi:hypothetical protein [Giesbergeria anulus]|uniref:Lipoprotein n=1 Tax=Giesbergeria anulus TaxID=180197 RepID=A0A1H9RTZ4_9BURK|nr:hypothetical protein [Giesbergeria anulus]SER76272.1 hypothetical protein SAMN02982919_02968 [Giesbergeria anulus]